VEFELMFGHDLSWSDVTRNIEGTISIQIADRDETASSRRSSR